MTARCLIALSRAAGDPCPANPYDGEIGALCVADEYKVEVCCAVDAINRTVESVRAMHPYEEPVINVIPLISL